MTDTLDARSRRLSWRRAQQGLWVATSGTGGPVGIVTERWTHGFVVTGRTGRNIGTFPSLDEAEAALEETLDESLEDSQD